MVGAASPRPARLRRAARPRRGAGCRRRPRRRAGARREVRADRPDRRAAGRLQLRRAVHPHRHRPPARRGDRRAARPVERHRPRGDRLRPRTTSSTAFEYHLDFPGNALDPGCDYNRWAQRLTRGQRARRLRARRRRGRVPGKLALQYWFFYPFNDFNNTHEGDWEMIQLVFDAPDARAALGVDPVEVGYSSHEGAERAAWDDEKLELVGRVPSSIRPPAPTPTSTRTRSGSGSSAEAGVGCDDTRGPHRELSPRVVTIPSDRGGGEGRVSLDRFRGALGRAPEGVLQRADRPEPEDAVDEADHLVRGLARRELRGADGRGFRYRDDRLLLLRGREGLEGARAAPQQPASAPHRPRRGPRPRDLRGRPCDLDSRRAAADRAPAVVGPDHLCLGEDVRQATLASSSGWACSSFPSRSPSPSCSGCCSARSTSSGACRVKRPARGRSSP